MLSMCVLPAVPSINTKNIENEVATWFDVCSVAQNWTLVEPSVIIDGPSSTSVAANNKNIQ